jgi:hypothetical protein
LLLSLSAQRVDLENLLKISFSLSISQWPRHVLDTYFSLHQVKWLCHRQQFLVLFTFLFFKCSQAKTQQSCKFLTCVLGHCCSKFHSENGVWSSMTQQTIYIVFSIEDLNALVVERPAKCGSCMKENFLLMVAPLYYLTNHSMH